MTPDSPENELIARATRYANSGADQYRYSVLSDFLSPFVTRLSAGSAGSEPIIIGATHAIDLTPLAGEYLRRSGWEGKYCVGSVTDLPFCDLEFDAGVCSEVIEHLPTIADAEKAISEMNRVCRSWMVTTPCVPVPEPDHKHFFHPDKISEWVRRYRSLAGPRYSVGSFIHEPWVFVYKVLKDGDE